eukprot:1633274-Amphidinium_carterae.2
MLPTVDSIQLNALIRRVLAVRVSKQFSLLPCHGRRGSGQPQFEYCCCIRYHTTSKVKDYGKWTVGDQSSE